MEAQSERVHVAHNVFARFLAPTCMLGRCSATKISASELSLKFIKSALLVGRERLEWKMPPCLHATFSLCCSTPPPSSVLLLLLLPPPLDGSQKSHPRSTKGYKTLPPRNLPSQKSQSRQICCSFDPVELAQPALISLFLTAVRVELFFFFCN